MSTPNREIPNYSANPDIAGYNVYRRNNAGAWEKLTATPLAATDYIDGGLANGRTYAYHLTAVDFSGNESKPSMDAVTTVQKTTKKPKTPVQVAAVIPAGDLVLLTWDNASLVDAARVAGFNVYRRVAGAGDFQKINAAPTPYKLYYNDVQNAGMAGKYQYAVTAVDAFGHESLQSSSVQPVAQP